MHIKLQHFSICGRGDEEKLFFGPGSTFFALSENGHIGWIGLDIGRVGDLLEFLNDLYGSKSN